jgi:hypothetical protein
LVAEADEGSGGMPSVDELLTSVRNFLHEDVMDTTTGRTQFLARVAGNSLDIVLRDAKLGAEGRQLETARLSELLNTNGNLILLNHELVTRLRDGSQSLDDARLTEHLRTTVVNQVAIDQPKYSGLARALSFGKVL